MMKKPTLSYLIFNLIFLMTSYSQNTPFEKSGGTETATYVEIISHYNSLASNHKELSIIEAGMSDIGKPIHVVFLNNTEIKSIKEVQKINKPIIFINNGIHPGEPCGIDACMLYTKNLLSSDEQKAILNDVIICIVPVYNIGGCLNRNSTSRANQIGPKEYGFRGNAKHLDLNRDFLKCDSENAKTFNKLFTTINPTIFIDTHTTNGADYQSTMTLISTQKDKLHHLLDHHLTSKMEPFLYQQMNSTNYKMCPYVNHGGKGPESGISAFLDLPRYSTGYTTLFNTIGFITEAHMLKSYTDRVMSTYQFIELLALYTQNHAEELVALKMKADEELLTQKEFALQWELNDKNDDRIEFLGYEQETRKSNVTGADVIVYNTEKPFTRTIPYHKNYNVTKTVKRPWAYIIPCAWKEVVERMQLNNVALTLIKKDTLIKLPVTFIENYETLDWPFEGHYLHHSTSTSTKTKTVQLYAGDYLVVCNQKQNRYIIETLEPESADSFFNWNFFDSVLMQKEYFSDYLFDATAEKILAENAELKSEFEAMKLKDVKFANSASAQLDFIYKRSNYLEQNYLRYPIIRIEEEMKELIF